MTLQSPTYDLITLVKMFVSKDQLGLICVFVFNLQYEVLNIEAIRQCLKLYKCNRTNNCTHCDIGTNYLFY